MRYLMQKDLKLGWTKSFKGSLALIYYSDVRKIESKDFGVRQTSVVLNLVTA